MKRIVALLSALLMLVSLGACSSEKVTMKDLFEANHTETLLERYDSVSVKTTINGEMYTEYYLTEEYSLKKMGNQFMYLTDEIGYVYENDMYRLYIRIDRNGLAGHAEYREEECGDAVLSKESLQEKIQSITENEGRITVVGSMDAKTLRKVVGEESLKSYDVEYVVDASDYRVMTAKATFGLEDGTSVVMDVDCGYNEEMPEEIDKILAYKNQTEDLRSVTLVFQAGTKDEKVECLQVPKGMPVSITLAEGSPENYSFYTDAAYTQPHTDTGNYDADVTIYVKWNS